jgi:hypothetical protein
MIQCVDKYDVREYVKKVGCEEILNTCYGVYDKAEDIPFSKLPDKFVLKDTLGGGGNSVIIVKDKNNTDLEKIKKIAQKWTEQKNHHRSGGREWPYYYGKNHRIIVEKYIESNEEDGGLIDYKFFCFDGIIRYIYVIADRKVGEKAGFGIFTDKYKKLDVVRCDEKPLTRNIPKPILYNKMLKTAHELSKVFPEVRIDLYCVNEKIYFGEMTFFDGSGYMKFEPDKFDYELGEKFKLPLNDN